MHLNDLLASMYIAVAIPAPVMDAFAITLIGPSLRRFLTKAIPIRKGNGNKISTLNVKDELLMRFDALQGFDIESLM